MIEMTDEARTLLDRYIRRARLSLSGTAVDAAEIEADVRAHVEEALADRERAICESDLQEVLARLGSPDQWVREDELPAWRRVVLRMTSETEDWRLAYLSFGLTLVGLILLPVGGVVFVAGAVFVSRAALSIAESRGEDLGARRWLLYPVLVILSAAIALAPAILPVIGVTAIVSEAWQHQSFDFGLVGAADAPARLAAMVVAFAGGWWIVLAALAAIGARPVRWALVPIANGFRPRHSAWLGRVGAILVAGSIAALVVL